MVSRKNDKLTYHTNTGTEGVWWEVAPKFPLHDAGVSMRAGDTTKISISENAREAQKETHTPR